MTQYVYSLVSVLLFVVIGYLSKKVKLLDTDIAKKIIKFLFTIPLPLLVFSSFATNPINPRLLTLPLIACVVTISLLIISYLIGKQLKLSRKTIGTLMTASGISSTLLFALPFVITFFGQEKAQYLFLYDFGNGLMAWTVVYYIAGKMGNKQHLRLKDSLIIFLKNPMIWALLLGIITSIIGIILPPFVGQLSQQIAGFTNPLILCCVGIFLNLDFFKQKKNIWVIIVGAIISMGISFGLAVLLTRLSMITGVIQKIVLICALAPAGTLSVAFSAEHELDTEFASALVAATMFIALLLMPVLLAM